ncbi:MAG: 5-bromo-4-chloroindolyl phosphate hydrolysis family protein [Oscillospiraceae bacterium]|nr:5-bromo-4-chloroindolyl phosphate hydrolysis family protein [Oscillospiraceae bacterium]
MDKKPRKNDGEAASWIVTLIMLHAFWPLGLVCLFSKLSKNDFVKDLVLKAKKILSEMLGRSDSKTRSDDYTGSAFGASRGDFGKTSDPYAKSAPQDKAAVSKVGKGRVWLVIFGWVLFALGVFCIFDAHSAWKVLQWLAVALGGLGMLFASGRLKKKEREYAECLSYTDDKAYVNLSAMMSALGLKRRELMRHLEDMITRGYFGESAYIDRRRDILVLEPSQLDPSMRDEPQPGPAAGENTDAEKDKYDLLLAEIRRASVRIQDEVMTDKTNQIEKLTASIFAAVKDNPEKLRKISRFLNYYLPTTLKLLNQYADFEQQGFQGDNMSRSKERIEDVTDTLIAAYAKQLDSLFLSESIDVDSDIDVLETMMKRDGLSDGDFGAAQEGGVASPGV